MSNKTIHTLQYIIAELVERSQSGHPGAAISLTPLFHILHKYLRFDPNDPLWADRDAVILSNGHACLVQYLFLHLTNRISFDDLLAFRSLNSRTPGHPEVHTPGVEVTTGPLGQGLINAVGFGISQRLLNATGVTIVVFGDGCYMEGVSHEAFSLAAHYSPRAIFIYDCNGVTIDGSTELAMSDCFLERFRGYGFNVKVCEGYENVEEILKTKIRYMRGLYEDSHKNINMDSHKNINMDSQKNVPEDSQKDVPEDSQKNINMSEDSRKNVPEDSRKSVPEDSRKSVPEDSRKNVPEDSHKNVPEDSHKNVPEDSRKNVPEDSRKSVPEDSHKNVPEDSHKNVPEDSRKNVPEDSQKKKDMVLKGNNIFEDMMLEDLLDERILMLVIKNKIAMGTDMEGSAKTHGAPMGRSVVDNFASKFQIDLKEFKIPDSIYDEFKEINQRNSAIREQWNSEMLRFKGDMKMINTKTPFFNKFPDFDPLESKKFHHQVDESVLNEVFRAFEIKNTKLSTRKALFNALEHFTPYLPFLISGSADLTPSCLTRVKNCTDITKSGTSGTYMRYGIREHGMFGLMNGISAHGFFLPLGSTFLNFITYGFPAVRLAALSKFPAVYIMTHDSIGLGEDGPTHQPIETLALLRATPGLVTFRPCDQKETFFALKYAIIKRGPVILSLSRQDIESVDNTDFDQCRHGAYRLLKGVSAITILATGSEVPLAVEVGKSLGADVVSMVSFELFEEQSDAYKKDILKGTVISIEALSTFGWHKYAHFCIGIDGFGKSGKGEDLYRAYGFYAQSIVERVGEYIRNNKK